MVVASDVFIYTLFRRYARRRICFGTMFPPTQNPSQGA